MSLEFALALIKDQFSFALWYGGVHRNIVEARSRYLSTELSTSNIVSGSF